MTNKSLYTFFRYSAMSCCTLALVLLSGCDGDDPEKPNTPELITRVTLTFTPAGGGGAVEVNATDPDGEGVADLTVDGPINLEQSTVYTLAISLINQLADPSDPAYDVTAEVQEEGDEHLLLYSWTNNVFADPTGNGNIDSRTDDVNYVDQDGAGLPIGLATTWTTGEVSSGTFRVVLKHQPDLKTETSGVDVGETDLDITFTINVQ